MNKKINEFSSIELLTELGQRLKSKEIEGFYTKFASLRIRKYPGLAINNENDNIYTQEKLKRNRNV